MSKQKVMFNMGYLRALNPLKSVHRNISEHDGQSNISILNRIRWFNYDHNSFVVFFVFVSSVTMLIESTAKAKHVGIFHDLKLQK